MKIKVDDLSDPRIAAFLEEHIEEMRSVSPSQTKNTLDVKGLRKPDITFWAAWQGEEIVACGALKELSSSHAEVKSMRVSPAHRGKKLASKMLKHILSEAKLRGYQKLSLETGPMAFFEPAHQLYRKFGFKNCAPFGSYKEDPGSIFMLLAL